MMKKTIYLLPLLLILSACHSPALTNTAPEPIVNATPVDHVQIENPKAINGSVDTSTLKAQAESTPPAPTSQTVHVDTSEEVIYLCGDKKERVRVMYGFNGDNAVTAQVSFQDKVSPVLLSKDNTQNNTFENAGIIWITQKATLKNIDSARGEKLIAKGLSYQNNGQSTPVSNTIVQSCQVDKQATLALRKQESLQKQRSK